MKYTKNKSTKYRPGLQPWSVRFDPVFVYFNTEPGTPVNNGGQPTGNHEKVRDFFLHHGSGPLGDTVQCIIILL